MTFTPVNQETFKLWCDLYKERVRKQKEEMLTEMDLKQTGKQLFEQRKNIIDELQIDEEDAGEEFKDEGEEGVADEEDEQTIYYDKALYSVDLDEEVDFE